MLSTPRGAHTGKGASVGPSHQHTSTRQDRLSPSVTPSSCYRTGLQRLCAPQRVPPLFGSCFLCLWNFIIHSVIKFTRITGIHRDSVVWWTNCLCCPSSFRVGHTFQHLLALWTRFFSSRPDKLHRPGDAESRKNKYLKRDLTKKKANPFPSINF